MRISSNQRNRKLYNWLVYKIGDKYRKKYSHLYKGTLYDLGCGEKPYENYLKNFVDKYVGVDWSNTKHDSKADIIADLDKPLKVPDCIADTVISFSVLEHLSEPNIMLSEAFRILKPNGNIIIQVPFQWRVHEAPYDYQRFTPYGLKNNLAKAGFRDIIIEPSGGFFTMLILKLNYFSARFIRGPKLTKFLIRLILIPFWTLGQLSAPYLDKLDRNWESEAVGYWVTAKK